MVNEILDQSRQALQHYATLREMTVKARETANRSRSKLADLTYQREALDKAGAFLRIVSDWSRRKSIGRIEETVNAALIQIFEPRNMRLKVEFDTKASRVNANLYMTNGEELEDIMDGRGGGVRDIVSVLLRIMFKKMTHPPIEGPLMLDEALKQLNSVDKDNNYVLRAYRFIQEISRRFEDQVIIVTNADQVAHHGEALEHIDRMFRVKLVDGASKVTLVYEAKEEKAYGSV
jgi:hypothetical protein